MYGYMDGWMDGYIDICFFYLIIQSLRAFRRANNDGLISSFLRSKWLLGIENCSQNDPWRLQNGFPEDQNRLWSVQTLSFEHFWLLKVQGPNVPHPLLQIFGGFGALSGRLFW